MYSRYLPLYILILHNGIDGSVQIGDLAYCLPLKINVFNDLFYELSLEEHRHEFVEENDSAPKRRFEYAIFASAVRCALLFNMISHFSLNYFISHSSVLLGEVYNEALGSHGSRARGSCGQNCPVTPVNTAQEGLDNNNKVSLKFGTFNMIFVIEHLVETPF